jgi:hypothetical protein
MACTFFEVQRILRLLGYDLALGSTGKSMHICSRVPCRPNPGDVAKASGTGRTCS